MCKGNIWFSKHLPNGIGLAFLSAISHRASNDLFFSVICSNCYVISITIISGPYMTKILFKLSNFVQLDQLCPTCPILSKLSKLSNFVQIVQIVQIQIVPILSKLSKLSNFFQLCPTCSTLSNFVQIVQL